MELHVKKSLVNCLYDLLPVLDNMNKIKGGERTLHNIVELLSKDLNCKSIAIVEINPHTELMEIRNFHNMSWDFCKNFHEKIEGAMLQELIWKGHDIYIADKKFASSFSDELQMEHDYVSSYSVQLIANQLPMGFLYVDSDLVDAFPADTRLFLQLYSKLISMILFMERITKRLEKMDAADEETGALRFEHFYPRLNEMYTRSKRLSEQMSVLLLDIVKFSNLVKVYGLDTTKIVLKELVAFIQDSLRPYDGICRYGADEFLIALPGTDGENAYKVAEKIKKLIKDKSFADKDLKIDVFIGLASYPENSATLDGLLTAVRTAIVMAKRGKDDIKITRVEENFD